MNTANVTDLDPATANLKVVQCIHHMRHDQPKLDVKQMDEVLRHLAASKPVEFVKCTTLKRQEEEELRKKFDEADKVVRGKAGKA